MLWEVDIYPAEGQPNPAAEDVKAEAADLGLVENGPTHNLTVVAGRGFLLQGDLDRTQVERIAAELLADGIVERTVIGRVGDC